MWFFFWYLPKDAGAEVRVAVLAESPRILGMALQILWLVIRFSWPLLLFVLIALRQLVLLNHGLLFEYLWYRLFHPPLVFFYTLINWRVILQIVGAVGIWGASYPLWKRLLQ